MRGINFLLFILALFVSACGSLQDADGPSYGTQVNSDQGDGEVAADGGIMHQEGCVGCRFAIDRTLAEESGLTEGAAIIMARQTTPVIEGVVSVVGILRLDPIDDDARAPLGHPTAITDGQSDLDGDDWGNLIVYPNTSYLGVDGERHEINYENSLGLTVQYYKGAFPFTDSEEYSLLTEEEQNKRRQTHISVWQYVSDTSEVLRVVGFDVDMQYSAGPFHVYDVWWETDSISGKLVPHFGYRSRDGE